MMLSEKVRGLFERLHVPAFRYVLRKTRDSGRAEDIKQEPFLRLFRQRECLHLRAEGLRYREIASRTPQIAQRARGGRTLKNSIPEFTEFAEFASFAEVEPQSIFVLPLFS
jgi:hypothetical protein